MGYLKLLELQDFKSWRGHQMIGPFKRFNCVIGPNGSGKSNVMDALSFVMGERTANLRVKSVRELIHGANIGKPVSSTASVKMVYSEENGEEMSFSRIIIGGSSEFRLDDKVVSRSVYIEELLKIGIVVKARNCLVFQGEVESIAMTKPKDRTRLFEQISNSCELAEDYEKKKTLMHQTEEDAQFNYNKKKNMMAERKHAKQEKEEAEHFQTLLKELKECKMQSQLFRLFHNEQSIDLLNHTLMDKSTEINNKKDYLLMAEETLKSEKKELGILNREQQQIEKKVKNHEKSLSHTRPEYIKAKENTSHQIRKLEFAEKSMKNTEKECSKQQQDVKEMEDEMADLEKATKQFEREIKEQLKSRGRDVELEESQLDQYKKLKELVRKNVATMTQQLDKLQWEQKADQERTLFDQRRQKEAEVNKKQIEEQIDDLKKRMEKLEEYISTCTHVLEEHRQNEESLSEEIDNSKKRASEVHDELNSIMHKLQTAKIDYHEDSRQKMKAEILESLKRMFPEYVFGRLFDLCHPIHKKYQLAVTKAFGRYMTAIVVSTEKSARDCIRFLKEQRAEPETFLALDYLDIKPINEKLRNIKGAKLMIDVVQTAVPQLKKVIQFVCGNGLVCESVNEARQIAFDGPERLKTVALDGTMYSKSGAISGGASDLRVKARVWDEKEMNELTANKDRLMNELRELMKVKRKETDLKQLQAQAQGNQTRLKYSQSELEGIKKKQIVGCYMEITRLDSELEIFESQIDMLKAGVTERAAVIEELQKKMNKVEDDIFHDFCMEIGVENIRAYEHKHVKQQEENEKRRLEYENQKTRLAIQLEYSCGKMEKEMNKIQKLKEAMLKDEAQISELKKEEERVLLIVNEALDKLHQFKNSLILKRSEAGEAQNQVEEARKKLLAINRELGKMQKEAISLETSIEQKRLDRHNLLLDCKVQDLQISLLLGSLDDISEVELRAAIESTHATADMYARERDIQIDYSSLHDDFKQLESEVEIKSQLSKLQEQAATKENVLLKTAAPNLRAIETFQNVRDKFQESVAAFEASRKKARVSRQEFENVKKRRYEMFSHCFEHVSIAIDQIYKKLCQNSSAQAFLCLENPEEPYLEGISYNCVAPGKRFMPMDNLSGGEKSVAALALLFAVHSFRPAPFVVLDEVDAALDNTNIGKVTSFIKEQSRERCQMIVISLKEEFYSKADALIGVCPEHGDCMYSRVLTLDLTQYEESEDNGKKDEKS